MADPILLLAQEIRARRAEENSSVKGQTSRELSLIKKELQRRKKINFPQFPI